MVNQKEFFFCQIGNFLVELEKNPILFGNGNGPEFLSQNWVIESPEKHHVHSKILISFIHSRTVSE